MHIYGAVCAYAANSFGNIWEIIWKNFLKKSLNNSGIHYNKLQKVNTPNTYIICTIYGKFKFYATNCLLTDIGRICETVKNINVFNLDKDKILGFDSYCTLS